MTSVRRYFSYRRRVIAALWKVLGASLEVIGAWILLFYYGKFSLLFHVSLFVLRNFLISLIKMDVLQAIQALINIFRTWYLCKMALKFHSISLFGRDDGKELLNWQVHLVQKSAQNSIKVIYTHTTLKLFFKANKPKYLLE